MSDLELTGYGIIEDDGDFLTVGVNVGEVEYGTYVSTILSISLEDYTEYEIVSRTNTGCVNSYLSDQESTLYLRVSKAIHDTGTHFYDTMPVNVDRVVAARDYKP